MLDLLKLREEQVKLSKKLILKDDFDINKITTIAGINQAYNKNNDIISAVVVCNFETMEILEKQHSQEPPKLPYLSGFRSYREGHAITSAVSKLSTGPDIILFSGNGILHKRNFGLASHIGLLLNKPSIGVTNKLSCGIIQENKVILDNKILAEVLETRKHSKPIFVSPGHKISLKTSVEIVKKSIRTPHKLPEPLHIASRYSKKLAKESHS